jgi:hypothetical protein
MQRIRVVPVLRERLGDQGTEALTDMVYAMNRDIRDEVLDASAGRFGATLTQEISALRVEVTKELAGMRVEIIRWSFVFWISQLAAVYGLLTFVK